MQNYMEDGRESWEQDQQRKEAVALLEAEGIADETKAVDMLIEHGFDEADANDAWHEYLAWLEEDGSEE